MQKLHICYLIGHLVQTCCAAIYRCIELNAVQQRALQFRIQE